MDNRNALLFEFGCWAMTYGLLLSLVMVIVGPPLITEYTVGGNILYISIVSVGVAAHEVFDL